jgi:hypothetical protein
MEGRNAFGCELRSLWRIEVSSRPLAQFWASLNSSQILKGTEMS